MSLRDVNFHPEYRSGQHDLVRDFYHPALHYAQEYWRAVGFFSSTALEVLGEPLGEFVARGGRMRLITSVRLEDEDIDAINHGLSRAQACENRLLERIRQDFRAPFGKGAALLASLLEIGSLEIKVALPRFGRGIYHEKVGVFYESEDKYVSFSGSSNESRTALESNYECIDVYPSWSEALRALAKRRHFEDLWEGKSPGVETLLFPDAARRELIQKGRASNERADSSGSPLESTPLWRHQEEALRAFLSGERGILEMATGTGKTKTALHACSHLLRCGSINTIIVAADGTDLLDQWYEQLLPLTRDRPALRILRHYKSHHEREFFSLDPSRSVLLISRQSLAPVLRELPAAESMRTLLIHDEVHRLGSEGNQSALRGLSEHLRYRLGLSATPEREYDSDGNRFVEDHIGPVLYKFELADAIRRGILAPFTYHPIDYIPDANDRGRLQQVYRRAAILREQGTPMPQEQLWTELARVHKTSRAKLPLFAEFIRTHPHLLTRCVIFVETRDYGDDVLRIVHQHRDDFHVYYADDDSSVLQRFASGEIQCIVTCHRISEGIDIRSLETVILFSSARARLETIQRMGRCLRRDPRNTVKRANVVDFVRESDEDEVGNSDQERKAWLRSLSQLSGTQTDA